MVDFFLRQNHACFMGFSWDFAGSNGYVYWNLMELHWNVWNLHLIFGDDWESPLHHPPVITM